MQYRLPGRVVVLVNADFESRRGERDLDGPRAYEADAAVLDTAAAVREAIASLGIEVHERRVTRSLLGVPNALKGAGVDVVFNLVESINNDYGREWQVPALLDRHALRYTGNAAFPLKLCRQKDKARKVLSKAGVRVAPGFVVTGAADLNAKMVNDVDFPLFVKPARVDGSIGIDQNSIVQNATALRERVALLEKTLPGPYLVEAYLPGKEINVAIFPCPLSGEVVPTEIDFSPVPGELLPIITYEAKWNPTSPEYASRSVPALLSPALRGEVEAVARQTFRALGGTGYGRVDMRLDAHGKPCVIDVNPNNDIHPEAGLALAAKSLGWDYSRLIASVLAHAFNRVPVTNAAHDQTQE